MIKNKKDTIKSVSNIVRKHAGSAEYDRIAKEILIALSWGKVSKICLGVLAISDVLLNSKKETD